MSEQTFIQTDFASWSNLEQFPGTSWLPLAEPVPKGSIHLLKMAAGTIIPLHTHPCNEYVYILSGEIETGGKKCLPGTFWSTPADIKQGTHKAITDVEIITIRLGEVGKFASLD